MREIDLGGTGILVALVAIAGGVLAITLALHLTKRSGDGFFRYFSFAVLLSVAVLVVTSGRSLVSSYATQGELLAESAPVSNWTTRLCSSFLMLASLERIGNYAMRRNQSRIAPHGLLLLAFVMFWCTTVASPALFGLKGSFTHEYLYTLLMGSAALLLSQREGDATVAAARNALIVFLGISVALIPLRPTLAMDPTYAGGLLPGVPRLAGLAPHAVSLGMLAELALFCLYARPLPRRWLNWLAWVLGLCALFLTQAKGSWLSFPVGAACIFGMRGNVTIGRKFGNARQRLCSPAVLLALLFVIVCLGAIYIFTPIGLTIDSLFAGQKAADLASFTGRDRIWAVALQEWARHPIFGYGSDLFDEAYRISIRMLFAVDGHNELVDTLARSGLVGAIGLAIYVTILLVFSVKQARPTRGLSLAIFVAIALRSVSEVPLGLFRYGPEAMEHFLLLAVLAGRVPARLTVAVPESQLSASEPALPRRQLAY